MPIFALPAGIPGIYYHGFNFYAHIASIIVLIATSLFLFRKVEEDVEYFKKLKIAYGSFFIFYAASNCFYVFAVFFSTFYDILVQIGYTCASLGFFPMIYVNEHYLIKKTRHVFSIIASVVILLYVLGVLGFLGQDFTLIVSWITSPTLISLIVLSYLYLAITSTGTIRRNAVLVLVSIAFIGLAAVIDGEGMVIAIYATYSTDLILVDFLYSIHAFLYIVGAAIFNSIQRITATMIDFYTNKRICIVHKGVIKGHMFICSKCNSFYCVKCKEAIESIDKCCWNCKSSFDKAASANAASLAPVEAPEVAADDHKVKKGIRAEK